MSIEVITLERNLPNLEDSEYKSVEYIQLFMNLEKGWKAWVDHFGNSYLENFSLISYPSILGNGDLEISIINHQLFIDVVTEHLDDFQVILNTKLTAREILNEYIKCDGKVFQTIHDHHSLLGILLGYGRENSMHFLNDALLTNFVDFETLNYEDMRDVLLPNFRVIENSNETLQLRKSYTSQREKINAIYQSELFLDLVLEKLTSEIH